MSRTPYLSDLKGAVNQRGVPALVAGRFTLNGASAPTAVGGVVSSVRRLVDGAAKPFFRVKLNAVYPTVAGNKDVSVVCGVRPVNAGIPLVAQEVTDLITANPADVRGNDEIDVQVTDLAAAPVDTAGNVVTFLIAFSS